ncbi:MAG: tat (twin-arginine translocation) pathway signal sequence [Bacteroidetes bacterium RBG_13_43_22]|nr:MAG: tat (twin-arginine translocation) pathway signal sequence [Bacteroidetes bacterium RBG_13_43_22]
MKRRDFLKRSAGAGLAAGAAISFGKYDKLWTTLPGRAKYDMVAVMGGTPVDMFDLGIQELGGLGTFIQKGQKVLVKPNIGWDVVPDLAANTNPLLVKRIIEHCFKAGAKEVYVLDHTCDNWVNCYKNSGIEKAAKDAGAKVVPANSEKYYQQVEIPGGVKLKSAKVHELLLESDIFINVPILKDHNSTRMTCCLKNMMGVVWDRGYWHSNDLNQCIADYALFERKPALNIIDCYNVMVKHGPQGVSKEDIVQMKSMIITTDWVAGDAAATKMLGLETQRIEYIPLAHKMGLGNMNLDSLNIRRIKM